MTTYWVVRQDYTLTNGGRRSQVGVHKAETPEQAKAACRKFVEEANGRFISAYFEPRVLGAVVDAG